MRKDERHIVTDEEFALFSKKVREFADMAGMSEWKIYTEKRKFKDQRDGESQQYYWQKKASIRIADAIHPTETIEYIAAHEVAELMLCQLDYMSKVTFNSEHVDEYRHEAVNHIVKLLLET